MGREKLESSTSAETGNDSPYLNPKIYFRVVPKSEREVHTNPMAKIYSQ